MRIDLSEARTRASAIGDIDVLERSRVVVIDLPARRIELLDMTGHFERFLRLPPDVRESSVLMTRLVGVPGGGLAVVDETGDRFFFYDERLEPVGTVPFRVRLGEIRGLVCHPSGDFFIVARGDDNLKELHRFDSHGHYLGSSIEADSLEERSEPAGGALAVDPDDGSLWMSRPAGYQIVHLTAHGKEIGRISPLRHGLLNGAQISVIGGRIVSTYADEFGTPHADVFEKDGRSVTTGLRGPCPLVLSRRTSSGLILRFLRQQGLLEVWREEPSR